jgi:hypothetical protein
VTSVGVTVRDDIVLGLPFPTTTLGLLSGFLGWAHVENGSNNAFVDREAGVQDD